MVPNWSTKELKTGPIEQYIATNNDVFFGLLPLPTTHTELPQQWRFREINASNDEYYRPSSVFDSFMMRRCYGICFRWPQGNIRWVYTPPINLEIAYDNLEFQVVVRFQVVVQQKVTGPLSPLSIMVTLQFRTKLVPISNTGIKLIVFVRPSHTVNDTLQLHRSGHLILHNCQFLHLIQPVCSTATCPLSNCPILLDNTTMAHALPPHPCPQIPAPACGMWVSHRENSPVTQTSPEPTLLSWGGGPREKFPPPPLATRQAQSYRANWATQTLLFSKPLDLAQACHGNKICSKPALTSKLTLVLEFPAHCISN